MRFAGDCGREIIVMIFLFKQGVVKIEAFDEVFEERRMIFYA